MPYTIDQGKKAISMALRYLSLRPRSSREVTDYLTKKNIPAEIIAASLEYLLKQKLLDDVAFARQWASFRLRQGKGDIIIRMELRQKGVAQEIIGTILANLPEEDWIEAIGIVIRKKRLSIPENDFKSLQQFKKTVYQRGFSKHYIDAFLHHKVQ